MIIVFRKEDLPQADMIDTVIQTVHAVANGARTYQQIAKVINKVERQGRYYRLAAEQLGLIETVSINYSKLTRKGEEYISLPYELKHNFLVETALDNSALRATYEFAKSKNQLTRDNITNFLLESGVSYSVARRRTTTLTNWLVDLGLLSHQSSSYSVKRSKDFQDKQNYIEPQEKENKKFFIPSYLLQKSIPAHNENPLKKMSLVYNWSIFGDISEEDLKLIRINYYLDFWEVVKCLAFHGVIFTGKLNRFKFSKTSDDHLILKGEDATIDYEYTYSYLKLRLKPYHIHQKSDLHLLPLSHLEIQNHMSESVYTFFKKEGFCIRSINEISNVINPSEYNYTTNNVNVSSTLEENKQLYLGGKIISIPSSYRKSINREEFVSTPKLVRLLNDQGYYDVADLPNDLSFLLKFPTVGNGVVDKFISHLNAEILEGPNVENVSNPVKPIIMQKQTISEIGFIVINEQYYRIHEKYWSINVEFLEYPVFVRYGIKKIGQLPVKIKEFLSENNVSKRDQKQWGITFFKQLPLEFLTQLFIETLNRISLNDCPTSIEDRNWSILIKRSQGITLEQIGALSNITRERVRQIIRKDFAKLCEIYESVLKDIENKVNENILLHVFDLFPEADEKILNGWRLLDVLNYSISIKGPLALKSSNIDVDYIIDEWFTEFVKKHSSIITFSNETIIEELSIVIPKSNTATFNYFLDLVLKSYFSIDIISNHYRINQRLNKAKMCLIVFQNEFPNGLAIYKEGDSFKKKIIEHFPDKFEGDSERSIISNLIRMEEDIVLWDNGFYVPFCKISPYIQEDKVKEVKDWFVNIMLKQNLQQINTRVAFQRFDYVLKEMQIMNPHALFSILKKMYPDSFNYAHSPTLVMRGHERNNQNKLLEHHVLESNDYVSQEHLKEHFVNKLGWSNVAYEQQIIYSDGKLIKAKDQSVIHIDNLDLDQSILQGIIRYTKSKLEQIKTISIDSIFDEKQTAMVHMNIKDSRILFEVLKSYSDEEMEFHRYPHVFLTGTVRGRTVTSAKQMEEYFFETGYSLLRDEVKLEFIVNRGWKPSTVHAAYNENKHKVVQLFDDEFIHVNHIGWNLRKQEILTNRIIEYWNEKCKNDVFINLGFQLNNDEFYASLPKLENGHSWSISLLSSFMEILDDTFLCIGNKQRKRLFVRIDNPFGVRSDPDFIAYLLKERYPGYVKKNVLIEYLTSIEFSKNKIPANCFPEEEGDFLYYENQDEFILYEMEV